MEPRIIFEECLEDTVYEGKQIDEHGVHLTAGAISSIEGPGQIDFGGDEHNPCRDRELTPKKRSAQDDYGWWELEEGYYRVHFNESIIPGSGVFLIASNDRLLACGCSVTPTIAASGNISTILTVPSYGTAIKENARIALLHAIGKM